MPKPLMSVPKTEYFLALYDVDKEEWMVGDEPLSYSSALHVVKQYQAHGFSVTIVESLRRTIYQYLQPDTPPDEGERMAA